FDDAATLRIGTGSLLARQGDVELHLLVTVGAGGSERLGLLDRGGRLGLVGEQRHGQFVHVGGGTVRRGRGAIGGGGGLRPGWRLGRSGGAGRGTGDGQDLLAGRAGDLLACLLVLGGEHLLTLGVGALESNRHGRRPVVVVQGNGAEGIVPRPRGPVLLPRRSPSHSPAVLQPRRGDRRRHLPPL